MQQNIPCGNRPMVAEPQGGNQSTEIQDICHVCLQAVTLTPWDGEITDTSISCICYQERFLMEEFIDGVQLLTLFRSSDFSVWSKHFTAVVKVAKKPQSRPTEKEHLFRWSWSGSNNKTSRCENAPKSQAGSCILHAFLSLWHFLYGVIQLFQFCKIVCHCVRSSGWSLEKILRLCPVGPRLMKQ